MTDLHDLPAARLLALFASRELSPLEYYDHLLAHIERWSRGTPRGMLDGVPVTLKALIATQGDCTPQGSAATALIPATEDAHPPHDCVRLGPSSSINCGFTARGMPIGLQMIAPRFADQWLLQCAKA